MEQVNNITKKKRKPHTTYEERIKIEALAKIGLSASEIGREIRNKDRRTIERELSLGMVELLNSDLTKRWEYSSEVAQARRDERSSNKGAMLKIGNDHALIAHIEKEIIRKKSPYAIVQDIRNTNRKFKTKICYKTIYNYLDMNLFLNISNKDLLMKRNGKKRGYKRVRQAFTNVRGTSISERPKEIANRQTFGHWEMDTVVGKRGTKAVLLVLSERKTRQELILKLKSKSQVEVIRAINKLERQYGRKFSSIFKTITCDNGSEFLNFDGLEKSNRKKSKRTKIYYAHPFSSWERGTNENINKMIRRFIPKGVDINAFGNKEIKRIQHYINNYPRRIFNGLSANMHSDTLKIA